MRVLVTAITLTILATLATSGTGCTCIDPATGKRYFCWGEVSAGQEAEIGARYSPDFIAQGGGRYPDRELYDYLNAIVLRMAKDSQRPTLPWHFEILNTSQVNAFALPGGRVFVTRGLLARLTSEAQFAHLMGHELGHVAHRHALRGQGRQTLLGILVSPIALAEHSLNILRQKPDDSLIIASTTGSLASIGFLKFSRDQELESDERGIDYALMSGYDPRESTKTFELFLAMKKEKGMWQNRITGLLSTHPLDQNRIQAIDRYIERRYPDVASGSQPLTISRSPWEGHLRRIQEAQQTYELYDQALEKLREGKKKAGKSRPVAASSGDEKKADELPPLSPERIAIIEEAEALLSQAVRELPDHAPFRVGQAVTALEKRDQAAARTHLDEALERDEDHFEARLLRGMVNLDEEEFRPAEKDLLRAHDTSPANPFPCYQIGILLEKLEKLEASRDWYQKALLRSPRGTDIRRLSRARFEDMKKRVKTAKAAG